jgi:hypothetical protein
VIPRLLQRDDSRGAARVTDVHALHVAAAAEPPDEPRVDARRETAGTGGRREEVDIPGIPPGGRDGAARRLFAELRRTALEPRLQLVETLVRPERRGIDVEAAAFDIALLEEPAAPRVVVTGERQQLRLPEALRRRRRRNGSDPGQRHRTSSET